MILEWFVDFVLGLFGAFVALFPWPEGLDLGGLEPLFGVMGTFNTIAPVTEALVIAGVVLTIYGVLFLYRLVKTALAHVPGIGGTG